MKIKGEQADLFTGQILAPQSEKYTNGGIRFGLLFHFN
jgi:hypothetical protein